MRERLGLTVALIVACWLTPAMAADLTFTTINAPPWAGLNEAGQPVGAFKDIVETLEARTGHRIAVTLHPFFRVERELESGEQDCGILLWNDGRGTIVERGEQVYPMTFGVVARRDVTLTTYEDLLSLAVSVVRNLRIDARFDGDDRLTKAVDKDYASGLRMMELGRVDAIAGALPTIRAQAERAGLETMLGDQLVLSVIPLVLQCSRRSDRLVHMATLDQAIRDMRADGTLRRLLARHGYQ